MVLSMYHSSMLAHFSICLLSSFCIEGKALSLLRIQRKAWLEPTLSAGTGVRLRSCCARFGCGVLGTVILNLATELILAAAYKKMLAKPLKLPEMPIASAEVAWLGPGE